MSGLSTLIMPSLCPSPLFSGRAGLSLLHPLLFNCCLEGRGKCYLPWFALCTAWIQNSLMRAMNQPDSLPLHHTHTQMWVQEWASDPHGNMTEPCSRPGHLIISRLRQNRRRHQKPSRFGFFIGRQFMFVLVLFLFYVGSYNNSIFNVKFSDTQAQEQ